MTFFIRCFRSDGEIGLTQLKPPENLDLSLGILIMIIDDFPNELLWRLWLEQDSSANVRIWFHAKCPNKIRSPWVQERLIRGATFKPEWGSIEITKVMAHMLHEVRRACIVSYHNITNIIIHHLTYTHLSDKALFDAPEINKFCFASESCIPIRSVQATLQTLYAPASEVGTLSDLDYNSSWLSYSHTPNNGYAKQLQVRYF